MSRYFDKDFFKFLLGFATIIAFSLTVILVAKIYQGSSEPVQANVVGTTPSK
jgi:hypothetical protein